MVFEVLMRDGEEREVSEDKEGTAWECWVLRACGSTRFLRQAQDRLSDGLRGGSPRTSGAGAAEEQALGLRG